MYKPIIDLSFHLAKEIVRAELNLPHSAITKVIENHLATIEQKGRFPVDLRLNSKDIRLNKEFLDTLPENITLIEDKSLNQGDIQLKISEGKINDFIKTKESNLRRLCNKYLENYSFEEIKETPTQSAEPTTEKEQPVEETKETPTQSAETSTQPAKETPKSAETSTEKEQPVEETKETPTQSAETSTEKEQPVEETKETPTQSAEPATEKEQPVEETKETPTQSAEPSTEKEQPVEETKETPTQSAEPSTEKEQPVEETKETPTQSAETAVEKEQPEKNKRNPSQSH